MKSKIIRDAEIEKSPFCTKHRFSLLLFLLLPALLLSQLESQGKRADKPLFHDPVYDGSGNNDFSRSRRTVIQAAELKYSDGKITCDRDDTVFINLRVPGTR